jgi:hypothetical protein
MNTGSVMVVNQIIKVMKHHMLNEINEFQNIKMRPQA